MTATAEQTKPQESNDLQTPDTTPENTNPTTTEEVAAEDSVVEEEEGPSYGKVEARVIRELLVLPPRRKGEPNIFKVEYVDAKNNAKQVECSPVLFKYMEEDRVTSMAKTKFILFINVKTNVLEYIKPEEKDIQKLYNAEDPENKRLDRELYAAPPGAE